MESEENSRNGFAKNLGKLGKDSRKDLTESDRDLVERMEGNSRNRLNHVALYRKYRPRSLKEVVGQAQVTEILAAQTKARNFAQGYLLTGQRGTGKTSIARILAHLINETDYDPNEPEKDFDIIEIDAASHGSVDDARELREKSALTPLSSRYKIYIIDEVHMLSRQAFDALLKLIEEPPAHLKFILATTEVQKVPATILSRTQRFHLRPVRPEIVAKHLREICVREGIEADDEALLLIAKRGEGSFRDAITLLDQLSSSREKITRKTVEEILGLATAEEISRMVENLAGGAGEENLAKNPMREIAAILQKLFADGVSANLVTQQLMAELEDRAIEMSRFYGLIEKLLEVAKSSVPELKLMAVLGDFANKNGEIREDENSDHEIKNRELGSRNEENSREKIRKKVPENAEKNDEKQGENFAKNDEENREKVENDLVAESRKIKSRKSYTSGRKSYTDENLAKNEKEIDENLNEIREKNFAKEAEKIEENHARNAKKKDGDFAKADSEDSREDLEKSEDENGLDEIDFGEVLECAQALDLPAQFATLKSARCKYENGKVVLYFAKSFARKNAEKEKFREFFAQALGDYFAKKVGLAKETVRDSGENWKMPSFEIAKTAAPENSDVAKVLEILGGEIVDAE